MENKETLEEAAERLAKIHCDARVNTNTTEFQIQQLIIKGAKWQQEQFKNESTANYIDRHIVEALVETAKQERSYSKEDMAESFMACWTENVPEGFECKLSFNEWIEKFKKK